jgi:predicted NUDIX family NTP pyrophosphohydrolase
MPRRSAGILLYRTTHGPLEVLLVHPGGPFYSRRDLGNWGVPKGEYEPDEEPQACAVREFEEELGQAPPSGPMTPLGEIRQKNNKIVTAWATSTPTRSTAPPSPPSGRPGPGGSRSFPRSIGPPG